MLPGATRVVAGSSAFAFSVRKIADSETAAKLLQCRISKLAWETKISSHKVEMPHYRLM